jgi:ERCC4-type nuclease
LQELIKYDKIPSTKYTNEVTTKVAAITWASLRFLPSSLLLGIGKARRTALLNHFGGLQELKQASVEEMQKVNGISPALLFSLRPLPRQRVE